MDDVELAIFDAWKRVWPRLKADPAEWARRVERRRRTLLGRRLRAGNESVTGRDFGELPSV